MKITFHGGLNEIGGNKILLEAAGTSLFLDFGKSFGEEDRYFDFPLLTPSTRDDLERTGILPRIPGLYRNEHLQVVYGSDGATDVEATDRDPQPVDAVLLSHAHTDHCAYLGHLRRDIPVFTNARTRRFMELREDQRNRSFDSVGDFGHFQDVRPREPFTVGGIEATFHPVDHSIVGSGAFLLDTGDQVLGYTGDLRFHGYRGEETEAFLRALEGTHVDVLLCEGTRVAPEGHDTATCPTCGQAYPDGDQAESHALWGEEEVYARALETARATDGLLIYDGSPADLDRVRTLSRVARATGRVLLVDERKAHLLLNLADDVPDLPGVDDFRIVLSRAKLRANVNAYKDLVGDHDDVYVETFLETRYGLARDLAADERVATDAMVWGPHGRQEIVDRGDEFLLYTSNGIQTMMQFKPDQGKIAGTYVYGKAEPFNEEMEIRFSKLENWARLCGLDWAWAHTSGHAPADDIQRVVEAADPDVLVPIHTEHPEILAGWVGDERSRTWPMGTPTPVTLDL